MSQLNKTSNNNNMPNQQKVETKQKTFIDTKTGILIVVGFALVMGFVFFGVLLSLGSDSREPVIVKPKTLVSPTEPVDIYAKYPPIFSQDELQRLAAGELIEATTQRADDGTLYSVDGETLPAYAPGEVLVKFKSSAGIIDESEALKVLQLDRAIKFKLMSATQVLPATQSKRV